MVSTLLQHGQEEYSSSPRSDLNENLRNVDDEEISNDLTSLREQMNGVIAGDDEAHLDQSNHPDERDRINQEDEDEQDGSTPSTLINLPQQIVTILRNENSKRNSLAILNEHDEDEQDQTDLNTSSPSNSFDFQQQQQQQPQPVSSTSQTTTTTNLPRTSTGKLAEDFCDICQKHFCNKYYLRVSFIDPFVVTSTRLFSRSFRSPASL